MFVNEPSVIGLFGLAVMGQNLALNIAEKGFRISVSNRTSSKVDDTVRRAHAEGISTLTGFHDMKEFVQSIQAPRSIILLVQAGKPVDETIAKLTEFLEEGDLIIDGGNEWYENTVRRGKALQEKGILYMGMGVSGGEEGARYGPSLMPGGPIEAYERVKPILEKIAANTRSGPCVTHFGGAGSGNYVKMIHNGIEYGDMQLIAEAYDILKTVGRLNNEELHRVFSEWNEGELNSFLIEITSKILTKKEGGEYVVDFIKDQAGSKGTGAWTIQEASRRGIPAPTMSAALDARYMSALFSERAEASKKFVSEGEGVDVSSVDTKVLVQDLRNALYASKICSYAQGMNLIRKAASEEGWTVDLGECARIWTGGCIIRAGFLDDIKRAYDRDPNLSNLLMDDAFSSKIKESIQSWRRIISLSVTRGVPVPAMSSSLAYFDQYRRQRLPANMIQAQRDYFGAHTYQKLNEAGVFHTNWLE